jgi:hypothetical protein
MFVHVKDAKYVDGYRIAVTFGDGKSGIADFAGTLNGPVFERLLDRSEFSRFTVDGELDTIVWESGADMAPEFIFFRAFKDDPDLQEQFKSWGYLPS